MKPLTLTLQDTDLVEDIRRGQTAAEAALYEKYSDRIYYLALKAQHSPADAEDVRAETFLRVLQAIRSGGLRSPQALASFILGTAHNVIRETVRRGNKTDQITDEEIKRREESIHYSPFVDAEVDHAIEQTIRRLKPREQAFMRMYYYEERPNEEIARRLGIKEERLRLIKSRAQKNFRDIYSRLAKKADTK